MLEALHTKLKTLSDSNLNARLKELDDPAISNKSSVAVHTRQILNKSIHIVEKSVVSQYLLEFDSTIPTEAVDGYYRTIRHNTSNFLDIMLNGGGAFIILKGGVTPSTKDIEAIKRVVSGAGVTEDEWNTNVSPFIPANGFGVFKTAYVKASNQLIDNPKYPSLQNFLVSSKNVGHSASSSNINFFMGSVVSSILAGTTKVGAKARTSREFIEENRSLIYQEFKRLLVGSKVNKKKLFDYFLNTQMTFLRRVSKNGITANLSIDFSNPDLSALVKDLSKTIQSTVTSVPPQNEAINQALGREIESQVARYLDKFYEASKSVMADTFTNRVDKESLITLKGSKSIKELIKDQVVEAVSGKITTKRPIETKTKKKVVSLPKVIASNAGKAKSSTKVLTKVVKQGPPALRNLKGQFTSTASIQALMNQMLHDTIKKNMQRPNLHYQTGRFAKSVKVEGITRARDGALTAFLSYMRYPYATFEAGGKQGYKGYYPSRLINESAREIATKLTRERFMSVTIK